ncbi:MAG: xylulokinase [Rectinemataceae bacterium]|nr:xylulokinase [Rectinemataceae bacterium]
MKTVCGIDLGTQSCKILVYDYEGHAIVAQSQASLAMIAQDDGTREQEATWFHDAVLACFSAIDPEIKATIRAIGVSGQQHGLVALDETGQPLRPVKLWCDTTTAQECDELTQAAGGKAALLAETGMLMLPGYTAPKLLWLKKHEPEVFSRLAHILLPHDYINFLLTGEYSAEYGDASGTALFDVRSRSWSSWICSLVDPKVEKCLPRLLKPEEAAGRVGAAAAREFGIPQGAIVAAGGGDNMMGAIGTGCVRDGFLTMSLGTSGTLYGFSDTPLVDPAGNLAAFCASSGGWLPLLCTMNCTVASEQMRSLLDIDLARLNALAEKAPIGAEGLVVLPFFNGERIPNLPEGRASVNGMTASNFNAANLARAAMESAVFGMKIGLDSFRALGFDAREIRIIGGGAKSRVWRSMAANLMGLPVRVPAGDEAAAMGAAIQALFCAEHAAGNAATIGELVDRHIAMEEGDGVEPDPSQAGRWEEAYAEYSKYLGALSPLYR